MKARLIKKDGHYDLYVESIGLYTSTYQWTSNGNLLSKENCEAIERGYDLDDCVDYFEKGKLYIQQDGVIILAGENGNNGIIIKDPLETRGVGHYSDEWNPKAFCEFKQKALELMGDKKFSEEDIIKAMESMANLLPLSMIDNYVQSLQQTEWDVEIVEEPADLAFYESGNRFPIDANLPDRFKYKPKLDADECLILKTI